MISILHLFWVVPLSATLGALVLAYVWGGDCDPDWHDNEEYDP